MVRIRSIQSARRNFDFASMTHDANNTKYHPNDEYPVYIGQVDLRCSKIDVLSNLGLSSS